MMIIPLQALPNEGPIQVLLGGQACVLNVYQKGQSLYIDVTANGTSIQQCKQCRNNVVIVRHAYLGFIGDLVFVDTQGLTDPVYPGFGSGPGTRYVLVYLAPADLPAGLS